MSTGGPQRPRHGRERAHDKGREERGARTPIRPRDSLLANPSARPGTRPGPHGAAQRRATRAGGAKGRGGAGAGGARGPR